MLCMATLQAPSCSDGINIPQPVCEYGSQICQTLTYLCDLNQLGKLSPDEVSSLQNKLSLINQQLTELKVDIAKGLQK